MGGDVDSDQDGIEAGANNYRQNDLPQPCQNSPDLGRRLKVLVIEDNPADIKLLRALLAQAAFELKFADRLAKGLECLTEGPVDVILLDLSLPDAQGMETFYRLRCQVPNIPIVVLTGLEDEAVGNEAVWSGAQDYLVKGQVLPGLLARSINYAYGRHQIELKMKQLNESLERRVIQLATANQELDKLAQELALSSEQTLQALNFKSQFVAAISHEIRTPISAVLGITELLLTSDEPCEHEEMRRLIELIDESARSQLTLLNEILDLSKIEARKVELEDAAFCPVALLEDVCELFAASAVKNGVSLQTYIDPTLQPLLQGDSGRLREILVNLTSNAIKFTPQGEVVLRATRESEDSDYVTCRFSVSDSGIGLSESDRQRLFEPFVQTPSARKYGGTGLGLSICKRLVDLMGGQIGAESKPGKGSTFWFSVRLKRGDTSSNRLNSYALASNQADVRVLVVGDDSTCRDILRRYIEAARWRCDVSANAEEAVNMLHNADSANDPYGVAIVDLKSDSFAFAATIAQNPSLSSTRLIFLAGLGQRSKGEKAWEAGFSASLTRPVKQWHLLDCIAKVLNGPKPQPISGQTKSLATSAATLSEKRVLVAEDNPAMRFALVKQLERLGIKVDSVANGRDAVSAVLQGNYAFVLMDWQMPIISGLEATAIIRQLCPQHIPIIAVTCAEDEELCIQSGMDSYLRKPISVEQLREIVTRWVMVGNK
jgi:polar amino acid transport system substrate-binding protein